MTTPTPVTLIFTPMTLEDVPAVGELEPRSFSSPWPTATYEHELRHNRLATYWVIRPTDARSTPLPPILAYGGYWQFGEEAHVVTIATHPDWRRHKLAEWLLLEMLASARQQGVRDVSLEVRAGNSAAQALYQKLGFVQVGLRKRYYRDNGEDALLLTLSRLDQGTVWRSLAQRLAASRQLLEHFSPINHGPPPASETPPQ